MKLSEFLDEPLLNEEEVLGDFNKKRWSLKEACEYLDRSESTIRRWIKNGVIKVYQLGRKYEFDFKELKRIKMSGLKGKQYISENKDLLTEEEVFGDLYSERWSIEEAAEYLDRSVSTLRRWIKSGILKAYQVGRKYEFDFKYLKEFKKSGTSDYFDHLEKYEKIEKMDNIIVPDILKPKGNKFFLQKKDKNIYKEIIDMDVK